MEELQMDQTNPGFEESEDVSAQGATLAFSPKEDKVQNLSQIKLMETVNEDENEEGYFGLWNVLMAADNPISRTANELGKKLQWDKRRKLVTSLTVLGAYVAYVIAVIVVYSKIQDDRFWCTGDGLLYIITLLIFAGIAYFKIIKKYFPKTLLYKNGLLPLCKSISTAMEKRVIRVVFLVLLLGGLVTFYILDTENERRRLVSFLGLFFLVAVGYVFSYAPRKITWRTIIWGFGFQFVLAMLVLRWPLGNNILECVSVKVSEFLGYANEGSAFVFGYLSGARGPFAFKVLPVTIFFSFCTNILYYYGVVQWMVIKLGWLFQVTIGSGLCESMNAAGSIFLGMTESPLLVKPYLPMMTNSEIHAIMTAGFATIAGSVLAAYIAMGADPALLITASVMNAPAALAFSKLFYPNLRKSRIDATAVQSIKSSEANALHAGCVGVTNAIPLVANIAGNLIAFISFIAFFNAVFDWGCQLVTIEEGTCSLEGVLGYIFTPLAWLMGVAWEDCYEVGQLLGLKIAVNEFVAYMKLSEFMEADILSERSEAIATFALCGFGNLSSVGIMLGGLGPLAPERKDDMAKIAFRAMIAGSMATFSSACIAGTLLSYSSIGGGFPTNATTTSMPFRE